MAETFLGTIRSFLGLKSQIAMAALPLTTPATATLTSTKIRVPYTAQVRKEGTTFNFAAMPSDTIAPFQRAVGVLREHCGYDRINFPEIQMWSLLSDTMPGISRDAAGTLVITYSFARSSHWDEHETPEKLNEGYGQCQEFSAAEKAAMMQVFQNYEAACNVRFEEAENPENAYLLPIVQDQSKITFLYKGEKVETGGKGHFPDGETAPLKINPGTEGTVRLILLTHELAHIFGMMHPHDRGKFEKSQDNKGATQTSYEQGEPYSLGGMSGLPSTLQLLDIACLQTYYGMPKARPAKIFVVDFNEFVGTLLLNPHDTLKLQAMPAGLLDLRGGVENPSTWRNRENIWVTQSPTNVILDASPEQVAVLGNDSTHITMQGNSSGTVITHTNDRIDLGSGADKVMASCADAITHIHRFNPSQDTLLYARDVTRHELDEDDKGGTVVKLLRGTEPAGKIHLYGIPPAMLANSHIRAMTANEVNAVINAKRPFIYLREGDNGILSNCTSFHTLQFNTQGSLWGLKSHFTPTADGNTLIQITGDKDIEIARAIAPGERPPFEAVYHNGNPLQCVDGKASDNTGIHYHWTTKGVMVDAKEAASEHSFVRIKHDGIVDLGGGSTTILMEDSYLLPYIRQSESSSVKLLCKLDNCVTLSRFDVSKDQLNFAGDSVVVSPLENGQAIVALWKNDEPCVHILVEDFKGDPADLKCKLPSNTTIPVSATSLATAHGRTKYVTNKLKAALPELQKLAEQEFPSAEKETPPPIKKPRGRG